MKHPNSIKDEEDIVVDIEKIKALFDFLIGEK